MIIERLGRVLWWCLLSLAIAGLLFRSLIWSSWIPYPDQPYGTGDILDGLIALTVFGISALCLVVGIIIAARHASPTRSPGLKLMVAGVAVPFVYEAAHRFVPVFRILGEFWW
jgi:hypothetical protein